MVAFNTLISPVLFRHVRVAVLSRYAWKRSLDSKSETGNLTHCYKRLGTFSGNVVLKGESLQ